MEDHDADQPISQQESPKTLEISQQSQQPFFPPLGEVLADEGDGFVQGGGPASGCSGKREREADPGRQPFFNSWPVDFGKSARTITGDTLVTSGYIECTRAFRYLCAWDLQTFFK